MTGFIGRLFASTIGAAVERLTRRIARALVFAIAAAIFSLGLLAFLVLAGFFWLRTYFPPDEAALIIAGIMFVLAMLCILALALGGRRRAPPPQPAKIADELGPIVQLLTAVGLQREAAGILAGTQLAGRVRPLYLIAAAILVGVALGRKRNSRPPQDKP